VEGDAAGGVGWGEPVADSEDVVMAPHRPNLTLPAVALLAGVLLLAVLSLLPIAVAVGVVQGTSRSAESRWSWKRSSGWLPCRC
jgi:hypothetical protein